MKVQTSHMKPKFAAAAAIAVAITMFAAAPAQAAESTLLVPDDFVSDLSDTRATGNYELQGTGLHIWTEGNSSTDKVAEYVATDTALAIAGEPTLDYTNTSGGVPGFQLVVDFDADGQADGILIGETVYGADWWVNNAATQFVKDGAPSHTGGSGSTNHGTLEQWRTAFPDAVVLAFGFSLGSGVLGDGVLNAINFAGTRYTFTEAVVLNAKSDCKDGGWATSTSPVFENQGKCVSFFASAKTS
jgi:hypothetical protein